MSYQSQILQHLLENAHDYAIIMMDPEGSVILWNTGAENLLKWQETEIVGQSAALFFPPEERAAGAHEQELRIAREQGCAAEERWHVRKDGSRFWGRGRVEPVYEGELCGYIKIFRDLTERKRHEQEIHDANRRLEAALNAGEIGTWTWDIVNNRVFADKNLAHFFSVSPEEASGGPIEHYIRAIHPDDRASAEATILAAIQNRTRYEAEYRLVKPDGSFYWVIARGGVEYDAQGQPINLPGVVLDITTRREAEQARARAQAQAEHDRRLLDSVLDALPAGVIIADPAGKILHVNAACERLWGGKVMSPDVAGYREYVGFWHDTGKQIEPEEWAMARALQGEQCSGDLIEITKLDGTGRTIMVNSAAPIYNAEGKIIGGVAAEVDVTAQVHAEEALRESEQKFRLVADTMPQLVWSTLPDGFHDYYNARWFEYTGLTLEETQGEHWNDVLHPDDQARAWEVWRHSLETGELYEIEYRFKRHDGVYRWFIGRALPLRDEQGSITRWFGTCTDVDDQRRQQQEIAGLNVRLARAMRETHHRVKNNLQVIAALVEVQTEELGDGPAVHRVKQHVRALATIHDLLTQQAKEDIDTSFVSAEEVLKRLIPMLQATSGERRIHADIADVTLPVQKATSLALLASECVSNALKHAKGEVEITLLVEGNAARLEVCDDGAGFSPDFDPRKAANTGLELIDSTARWDLRGEVSYENREQGGGRVVVTFPLDTSSET